MSQTGGSGEAENPRREQARGPEQEQAWGPEQQERLRQAWVDEPPKLSGRVRLVEYDASWPELYERTKRRLAGWDWTYMQQYADAKTEVVEAILSRAGVG